MNSNRPFCEVCGSSERPLRCAQCKKVWYCNTQHQQIDWPGHRKFCQEERQRQVQLREAEENIRLQIAQPTTSSNATACLDFGSEFPDISALLDDTNIKIPEDIDLEKLLTEITSEVVVPEQQQVLPSQPPYNSFLMKGGGENCYLPTEIPPFAFERRYEDLCQTVISDMNTYGLSVIDDFLGREKGLQILSEVHRMYSAGVFTDGQVTSHSKEGRNLKAIRGDKIAWVKGSQDGYSNIGYLINQIDTVICRANKMNGNGQLGNYSIKERTKAMVACYPGSGAHYKMHVDNPNKDGRVITAIYYLNVDWDTKRSGGVLR
ncbi:EGLN1 family protein [Megaselia abdita]